MTFLAVSDGPPSLEATHLWTPWAGSAGPVINAPSVADVPLDGGGAPRSPNRIVLEEIVGFYSLPDADDARQPLVAQPGELVLPSERLGKTIIYNGHLEATTGLGLRGLATPFRGAFRDRFREGRMVITPGAGWGTIPWSYQARGLALDIDAKVDYVPGAAGPWQQEFSLTLRMADPRFYVWETDPESIEGGDGDTVVATNAGNDDTDPVFTIATATGLPDIHLQNLSVDTSNGTADLWLRAVPAGILIIDFRNRTITLDGENAVGYFDSAYTDWWDELIPGLAPGANSIKVAGGSWQMSYRHAST